MLGRIKIQEWEVRGAHNSCWRCGSLPSLPRSSLPSRPLLILYIHPSPPSLSSYLLYCFIFNLSYCFLFCSVSLTIFSFFLFSFSFPTFLSTHSPYLLCSPLSSHLSHHLPFVSPSVIYSVLTFSFYSFLLSFLHYFLLLRMLSVFDICFTLSANFSSLLF